MSISTSSIRILAAMTMKTVGGLEFSVRSIHICANSVKSRNDSSTRESRCMSDFEVANLMTRSSQGKSEESV